MNANTVAAKLKAAGLPVINVANGNSIEDGMVEITKTIHVQVPTYGNNLGVVRESPKGMLQFFNPTKDINKIVKKLKQYVR